MDFTIGQIVFSKAGKDKGNAFIIFNIDGDYLYLVDGKTRPLENPKKKKIKHVQPTKTVDMALQDAIMQKKYMKNADFRNALMRYENKREEISHG